MSNSIAEYLARKEVTQAQLAEQCGVSQPTVSDWAKGEKKPSGDNLHKLSKILRIPAERLTVEFHLPEA